jgi:hypothetical protein
MAPMAAVPAMAAAIPQRGAFLAAAVARGRVTAVVAVRAVKEGDP